MKTQYSAIWLKAMRRIGEQELASVQAQFIDGMQRRIRKRFLNSNLPVEHYKRMYGESWEIEASATEDDYKAIAERAVLALREAGVLPKVNPLWLPEAYELAMQ